ncbi:MAG TPA: hypothetical protein VK217_07820 [Acidimicrobiales bacterium]|nr:hypothetical protein [Acidimicrobiales bacterium]
MVRSFRATVRTAAVAAAVLFAAISVAASPIAAAQLQRDLVPAQGLVSTRGGGDAVVWSLSDPVLPTLAQGQLNAVSCGAANVCTAVGSTVATTGQEIVLAERWQGSAWAVQATVDPDDATVASLSGVSCHTSTACTAVGSYQHGARTDGLAEAWNGKLWTLQPLPLPQGARSSSLSAVSCSSSSVCTAVGSYDEGTSTLPLVERWNGKSWGTETIPVAKGQALTVTAVSCPSLKICTAVGSTTNSTAETASALRWNGSAWKAQAVPEPPKAQFADLDGVACNGSSSCTASGEYDNSNGTGLALAERWNGTTWSVQTTPDPKGATFAVLAAVSCWSPIACTGVGEWANLAGQLMTLAERWDGTAWAIQPTPTPNPSETNLEGVACPSVSLCVAAGTYALQGFHDVYSTLALQWSAAIWARTPAVNPVGTALSDLASVSCSAADACTAIGETGASSGYPPLIERFNGSAWSVQKMATAPDLAISAVSCPGPHACTAVGSTGLATTAAVAERWNGTSWSLQPTASGAGSNAKFYGVSCPSLTMCEGVGLGGTVLVSTMLLAELWNGTAWTLQSVPLPKGLSFPLLSAVSCASPRECVAVGDGLGSSNQDVPFAEKWNGSTWSLEAVPLPSGASSGTFSAVSCPALSQCVAVGEAGSNGALAELWNGANWAPLSVAPPPQGAPSLSGVSCNAQNSCTAVGEYRYVGAGPSLAERWNGKAWAVQSTPNRFNARNNQLQSVSCTSATTCLAAGTASYRQSLIAFAEIWG